VQFLNSPCFVCMIYIDLRLQLLEHYKYPYLLISLYAILMILPNSRSYSALQVRLKDVASLHRNFEIPEIQISSNSSLFRYEVLKKCFLTANWPQQRQFRMSWKVTYLGHDQIQHK
jgi:hypothetical protein